MLTFRELTGMEYRPESQDANLIATETGERVDLFEYFGFGVGRQQEEKKVEREKNSTEGPEDNVVADLSLWGESKAEAEPREEDKPTQEEQTGSSLFNLFGEQSEMTSLFRKKNAPKKKAAAGGMKALF